MRDESTPRTQAADQLVADRGACWLEENRRAIDSINTFVDRFGLLAARLRYRPENPGTSHAR
jgi:post-segregation antitoxin (ccd killing protein)